MNFTGFYQDHLGIRTQTPAAQRHQRPMEAPAKQSAPHCHALLVEMDFHMGISEN